MHIKAQSLFTKNTRVSNKEAESKSLEKSARKRASELQVYE